MFYRCSAVAGLRWRVDLANRGQLLFRALIANLPTLGTVALWTHLYRSGAAVPGYSLAEIITYLVLVRAVTIVPRRGSNRFSPTTSGAAASPSSYYSRPPIGRINCGIAPLRP